MGLLTHLAVWILAVGPAVAQSANWEGFYGGLALGRAQGDNSYDLPGELVRDQVAGGLVTGFAGFARAQGGYVYGGEIALSVASLQAPNPFQEYNRIADLKLRLGYPVGKSLIYGVAGYSAAIWDTAENWPARGPVYGFGVDVAVSDRVFAGAEVLQRAWSGEVDLNPLSPFDGDLTEVTLRLGFQF